MYNSSLAPDVVKTAIDLVYNTEFNLEAFPGYGTVELEAIFRQDTTDRQAVIADQFQGPGYYQTRAEEQDVPMGTARVGNQQTYTVVNYAKSIDISKNLMDDDQHSTIDKLIRSTARVGRMTKSKVGFNVNYNLGFSTTTTNDGIAYFATNHLTLNGTTVSNLETGHLTEPNLDIMFQDLGNQVTQDGTLGGHTPATLLVPLALFKTATEITKSEFKQGTTNNDMSYYSQIYPGLKVVQSPFLGTNFGGSNTAYFLLSPDHSAFRWVRQDITTDMIDYKYQRNNNYIYKAEYREVTAPISFEGTIGNNGTV